MYRYVRGNIKTLLEPQSRFGDNWGQITWNLSGVSPKRDWSSKRVNTSTTEEVVSSRLNPTWYTIIAYAKGCLKMAPQQESQACPDLFAVSSCWRTHVYCDSPTNTIRVLIDRFFRCMTMFKCGHFLLSSFYLAGAVKLNNFSTSRGRR